MKSLNANIYNNTNNNSKPTVKRFTPIADHITYRELLRFEERLKQNASALRKRKRRYECECFLFD